MYIYPTIIYLWSGTNGSPPIARGRWDIKWPRASAFRSHHLPPCNHAGQQTQCVLSAVKKLQPCHQVLCALCSEKDATMLP